MEISLPPGFTGLLDELKKEVIFKEIPARTLIYSEGDTCHAIAFLIKGGIRVYKAGESGREITLYDLGPGETCILNASAILSGSGYPANAVASEDTMVALLDAGKFRKMLFLADSQSLREFIFALLSRRLGEVMALVEEVAFRRMDERLMEYLKMKVLSEAPAQPAPSGPEGSLNTTHQKIASDLGTSREVVSRLLKDFERRGFLELHRNAIRLKQI
ncbi:MAG: Crp/Fnr family transcriptional regulator [Nitrospiraceae bacterium]|nr:Crp/Fnr family transcriptional regulator [Nitrospiraceae bacterium]